MEHELSIQSKVAKEPVSKPLEHKSISEAKAQPLIVKLELEQTECKSAKGQGPYGYAYAFVLGIWVVRFTPWFLYAEPWIQWSGSWTRKVWEPVQSRREDGSEFKD